jgi:hypothetical protein
LKALSQHVAVLLSFLHLEWRMEFNTLAKKCNRALPYQRAVIARRYAILSVSDSLVEAAQVVPSTNICFVVAILLIQPALSS